MTNERASDTGIWLLGGWEVPAIERAEDPTENAAHWSPEEGRSQPQKALANQKKVEQDQQLVCGPQVALEIRNATDELRPGAHDRQPLGADTQLS